MPDEPIIPPAETPPPPTPPVAPATDLPLPTSPEPIKPEDDPDHQLAVLISKRGERKAKRESEAAKEKPDKAPSAEKPGEKQEKLGDLIAGALKFKSKTPAAKPPEPKEDADPPPEEPKPAPTAIKRQKSAPTAADTATIAGQAAAAAATAAVQALGPALRPPQPQLPDPGESLKAEDRKKYEVAKYLAATNAHYKNAPKTILDQVARADAYAQRWESANPGKMFDPESDEHDEFYESLQDPWSETEFEEARDSMREEALAAKVDQKYQAEIESIKETNARLELAGDVHRRYSHTAGELAKALNVHETIISGGVEKLEEQDPIAAQALLQTLGHLQPLIETIVHIDDPKKRIKVDMNNPLHQQWAYIVNEGENRCVGKRDDEGKMFARRSEFLQMNNAQRSRHWYLTTDHILQGIAHETGKLLGDHVKTEKTKLKKIAESLGYVPRAGDNGSAAKPGAGKSGGDEDEHEPAPGPIKPQSPTVGGGAKIDTSGKTTSSSRTPVTHQIADILWKR